MDPTSLLDFAISTLTPHSTTHGITTTQFIKHVCFLYKIWVTCKIYVKCRLKLKDKGITRIRACTRSFECKSNSSNSFIQVGAHVKAQQILFCFQITIKGGDSYILIVWEVKVFFLKTLKP